MIACGPLTCAALNYTLTLRGLFRDPTGVRGRQAHVATLLITFELDTKLCGTNLTLRITTPTRRKAGSGPRTTEEAHVRGKRTCAAFSTFGITRQLFDRPLAVIYPVRCRAPLCEPSRMRFIP